MIDEQMKIPLPTPPKRQRRVTSTAKSVPSVPKEANGPEAEPQQRSVPAETQQLAAEAEPVKAAEPEPAETKQEPDAPQEPAAKTEESQPTEQEAQPENNGEATREAEAGAEAPSGEDKSAQEYTPAEAPQSEEPAPVAAASTKAVPAETEAPAQEPSAEPALEETNTEDNKATPEETAAEESAPATGDAEPAAEKEAMREDAPASDNPDPKEPAAEEPSAAPAEEPSAETEADAAPSEPATADAPVAAPEEPQAEPAAPAVEEVPAPKEAAVEEAAAEEAAVEEAAATPEQHADAPEAPADTSAATQEDATETQEASSQAKEDPVASEAPGQLHEPAEDKLAEPTTEPAAEPVAEPVAEPATEPAKEDVKVEDEPEFKPRDLDAEPEEPEFKPRDLDAELEEPSASENAGPATEPMEEEQAATREENHAPVAAEESAPPAGVVEGGAAEEYLEMAQANQHDESEALKSEDHLPAADDGAHVVDAQAEATPQERGLEAPEAQPESQSDAIVHENPTAQTEAEEKPQAEEHPTEDAGASHTDSAEKPAEAEQHPEPESIPSEIAESAADAEPVATPPEAATEHHIEAPAEEVKAPAAEAPPVEAPAAEEVQASAEEVQAPAEESMTATEDSPLAEAPVAEETQASVEDASTTDAPAVEALSEEKVETPVAEELLPSEPVVADVAPQDAQEKPRDAPDATEAAVSDEAGTEAPATTTTGDEAVTVDETTAVEENPAVEETSAAEATSAVEEALANDETPADAPAVESKLEISAEDSVHPSFEEKAVETPRETPTADVPDHDSVPAESHPEVPTETEASSVSHDTEPSAEASAEKPAPEHAATETPASADDTVSRHDDAHGDAPSMEAHKIAQPAQVVEEPEQTTQQGSALDNQPQEAHNDEHDIPTSEADAIEEPKSLPADSEIKETTEAHEHEHSEHEVGEKMSDSGYDSALTGSRNLDDAAVQQHHDEGLAAVQEDTKPTDETEPHPAEAEIQDQKEQQLEVHEGAGNVMSPSKGEDVQDSDNSQAAETFADETTHDEDSTEPPAAEPTKDTEVEQPKSHPAQVESHGDDTPQVEHEIASAHESSVHADAGPESHEEKAGDTLMEEPDQTARAFEAPEVAASDMKPSEPLDESLPSTESEPLAQEHPQQDAMADAETIHEDETPVEEPHQAVEPAQAAQENTPSTSLPSHKESRPTIDMTAPAAFDNPDEGLFAVSPTPRDEVLGGKSVPPQDDEMKHDRPEGTLDAPLDLSASQPAMADTQGPMEPAPQEHAVDTQLPSETDRPHDDSPKVPVARELHSSVNEPQAERDLGHPSSSLEDKDDHSPMEAAAAPQVLDDQPKLEPRDAPVSPEESADTHVHDDRAHELQPEVSPAQMAAPAQATDDIHARNIAFDEPKKSKNPSPVSSAFEPADEEFQTPHDQVHAAVYPYTDGPATPQADPDSVPHDLGKDAQGFQQALDHLPDETSAHTVQGTDQLFDDSADEDEDESEYEDAVISPSERLVYQAHGDDHNVSLGGNRSSTSLGRNSIASARSMEATTPVRVPDGSYLPGANIVRADWAGEHEEELRGPSTPPPASPSKSTKSSNLFQTPEPAGDEQFAPRDVTNLPWHARSDSIPASMHSQTTLSSVASSPVHSALPADKHEPVIRDSWVPAPGYQQYLSSWTGRARGDSTVSNNSEYDPFKAGDTVSAPPKSSIYNPFQARSRAQSSVSATPSNPSANAASTASPARGSVLFQKMRNIFESQSAGPDPNASMEPMRSPHKRPPSGSFLPSSFTATQQQLSSSERLREEEAYDPYRETDAENDERLGLLRGSGRGNVSSVGDGHR